MSFSVMANKGDHFEFAFSKSGGKIDIMNAKPVILIAALASVLAPAERIVPTTRTSSTRSASSIPAGRSTIERTSIKPSPVTLEAVAGIDAGHHPGLDDLDGEPADRRCRPRRRLLLRPRGPGRQHLGQPGRIRPGRAGHAKETNRVDDDANGYVDDVMGWDFAFDDPDPDCYVFDGMRRDRIQPYWHSISALGIIGARGNNGNGVAGINWDVSLMLLKIGAQGIGRNEKDTLRPGRAAKAIRYAADNGARVINWSGFVSDPAPEALAELKSAIEYAGTKNVLLVVGAGNSGLDIDRPENFTYPACFPLDNILTVAMIDFRGGLVVYKAGGRRLGSNFGPPTSTSPPSTRTSRPTSRTAGAPTG